MRSTGSQGIYMCPDSMEWQQLQRMAGPDRQADVAPNGSSGGCHFVSTSQQLKMVSDTKRLRWSALTAAATTVVLYACIAVAIIEAILHRMPLDAVSCQVLKAGFKTIAVLHNLQLQSAAAASLDSSSPQKLHILTIVGKNTPVQKVKEIPLLQSLPPPMRKHVRVLQADEPLGHGWSIHGYHAAFGAKIIELYKFINRPSVSPKDLVLLTDGFDVVINAKTLSQIPDRFAAITRNRSPLSHHTAFNRGNNSSAVYTSNELAVVFAAERGCWPDDFKKTCYLRPPSAGYYYLNAGGLIGHAGYLKALLQPYISQVTLYMDDQRFYSDAYLALQEQNGFFLDRDCSIFQTLHLVTVGSDDLIFDSSAGSWYNIKTQTFPVLLHGQGWGKPEFFSKIVPKLAASWVWSK